MGRNREPAALIEAKGNSHMSAAALKERYESELKVDLADINAPPYLDGAMEDEFYKVAAKLAHVDKNLFTELDEDVLARYLIAKSNYLATTALLSREMTKKSRRDVDKMAKLTRMQNTFASQCHTNASALGLTVVSRVKIVLPKTEEKPKENRFSKFNKR